MRTFALVFGLLGALLVVLSFKPPASPPPLTVQRDSVRVFDARNPARSIVDVRHEWTWAGSQRVSLPGARGEVVGHYADGRPIFDDRKAWKWTQPVLVRRDRASRVVVGRYAPATAKEEGAIGVESSGSHRRFAAALGLFRFELNRGRTTLMTYVRPIEERRPIF